MIVARRAAPAACLALLVATLAWAAPPSVRVSATADPPHATIGTPIRYTIRVEAPDGVKLVVPTLGSTIGDFRVVDFGKTPAHEADGHQVVEHWYRLVTYDPGDHVVPGLTVVYTGKDGSEARAVAPDVTIVVDSLLAKQKDAKDIREAKPPIRAPRDWTTLALAAAVLAALAAAVYAAVRWWRRRPRRAREIVRSAAEVALEELARLEAERLLEAGRHEEFYVRLSALVRGYVERRFGLRAPEMTTEEFLLVAQRSKDLAPAVRSSLSQFLTEADLVKFARHVPTVDDGMRAAAAARELVRSTPQKPEAADAAA